MLPTGVMTGRIASTGARPTPSNTVRSAQWTPSLIVESSKEQQPNTMLADRDVVAQDQAMTVVLALVIVHHGVGLGPPFPTPALPISAKW